jgi:hypothetical protein
VHYAKDIPDISILAEQSPYVKIRIGGQKIKTSVCKGEMLAPRAAAWACRTDSCADRQRRGPACAEGKTKPVWGEVLHYTLVNETDMHVAVSLWHLAADPPAMLCSAALPASHANMGRCARCQAWTGVAPHFK